jgi:hypothetical protein
MSLFSIKEARIKEKEKKREVISLIDHAKVFGAHT